MRTESCSPSEADLDIASQETELGSAASGCLTGFAFIDEPDPERPDREQDILDANLSEVKAD